MNTEIDRKIAVILIADVVYNLKMTYDPSLIDKSEQEGKDWDRASQRD